MNGTERTESIFTLIPSQTFCKEENMDLKKRGAEMRDFFDRKIDGYDEVHAKFTDTKRLLTENLREGTVSVLESKTRYLIQFNDNPLRGVGFVRGVGFLKPAFLYVKNRTTNSLST